MALDLSYAPSWFNRINYKVQQKLDEFLDNDPVAQLFTDRTDDNRSTTFDLTGRANSGFANFTVPGQKANSTLPVEEDQMSKNFVSKTTSMHFSQIKINTSAHLSMQQ